MQELGAYPIPANTERNIYLLFFKEGNFFLKTKLVLGPVNMFLCYYEQFTTFKM